MPDYHYITTHKKAAGPFSKWVILLCLPVNLGLVLLLAYLNKATPPALEKTRKYYQLAVMDYPPVKEPLEIQPEIEQDNPPEPLEPVEILPLEFQDRTMKPSVPASIMPIPEINPAIQFMDVSINIPPIDRRLAVTDTMPSGLLSDQPLELTRVDKYPQVISAPLPRYPSWARSRKLQAHVQIRFVVDTHGLVSQVVIESCQGDERFAQITKNAVKKWKFKPAEINAQPVTVWCRQKIDYYFKQ